jgi:hypothetical protein
MFRNPASRHGVQNLSLYSSGTKIHPDCFNANSPLPA